VTAEAAIQTTTSQVLIVDMTASMGIEAAVYRISRETGRPPFHEVTSMNKRRRRREDTKMKSRIILFAAVLCGLAMSSSVSVLSQDAGLDSPEGCCWAHFWGEGGFVGEDNVIYGPDEWPDGVDGPTGSLVTGSCATVTLWPQGDYQGDPAQYAPDQQVPDLPFATVGSMKMTCEGEE
jgi:hypothetical protein